MRKILLTAVTATALMGWNAAALATPPAPSSGHGEEHHDGKDDHKADKGHHDDGHHDGKDGKHHDDKHEAQKPKH